MGPEGQRPGVGPVSLILCCLCRPASGHGRPAFWTASHQGLSRDPADGALLRVGQQEACGTRAYPFLPPGWEVSRSSQGGRRGDLLGFLSSLRMWSAGVDLRRGGPGRYSRSVRVNAPPQPQAARQRSLLAPGSLR